MEDRRLIKILVPVVLLGLFVFNAPKAGAYGVETHAYLTSEIINFYNQNNSNNQISSELRNYLIDGSRKEDETPRWLNHFYDPVYDRGLATDYGVKGYRSKSWAQNASMQNEVRFKVTQLISSLLTAAEQRRISAISADANFTWNRAIEFYAQGENEKAMFALGHVLHLIEDLGVPDHTRNDDHPTGSPYEEFAKRFNLNNTDSSLVNRVLGRGVVNLNSLDGYFNSLATYSNNNFYSLDTIGIQSGYNLPQPDYIQREGDYFYGFKSDSENGDYKLFFRGKIGLLNTAVSETGDVKLYLEKNGGDAVFVGYWNHLSPKVVQHGAGVINLFFQEAEKAKNEQKFIKKEKDKNFLTKIVDAAKAAVSNIFNKTSNKPAAVIDVNKKGQQKPANNLTASVVPIQGQAVAAPKKTTAAIPRKENTKSPEKTQEVKQEQAVKQSVQECSFNTNQQSSHNGVIINEVAWMGGLTSAGLGASDEWIELKNITNKSINISGWQIVDESEDIQAVFKDGSQIPANGFYLLERTDDDSVQGIAADAIYTGALANSNEGLRLFDAGCNLVDEVLAKPNWPGGENSSRRTMQRGAGFNWSTYGGGAINGVLGTPKTENGPALAAKEEDIDKDETDSAKTPIQNKQANTTDQSSIAQANTLITEVQITGGTGKSNYDFVEIFNPTDAFANLNGHRLVKRSKTGTSDTTLKSWTTDTIIPAQGYYLWANSDYTEIGATPDITTSGTLSNDNGVAIRFGAADTGTIVDSVGWGAAANAFVEGSVFATNPGTNESINRKTGSGYIDTGNNANDFEIKTCLTPKAPPCAVNKPPNASFIFNPTAPEINTPINFDATGSGDPDGSIIYYLWEFGDPLISGSDTVSSTKATTTYQYSTAGSYNVRLTVIDDQNASSTTLLSISINNPAPPPPSGSQPTSSILFQQPDNSGEIAMTEALNNGSQSFPLGNGADGSANRLRLKFKPEGVTASNQFYIAPWRIKENGGAELGFWYAGDQPYTDQPKYCFTPAETGIWKEVTFAFASPLNFLASKTYNLYLVFKRDEPERVCNNDDSTGTGSSVQGTWAANASNSLIYFQIGS